MKRFIQISIQLELYLYKKLQSRETIQNNNNNNNYPYWKIFHIWQAWKKTATRFIHLSTKQYANRVSSLLQFWDIFVLLRGKNYCIAHLSVKTCPKIRDVLTNCTVGRGVPLTGRIYRGFRWPSHDNFFLTKGVD